MTVTTKIAKNGAINFYNAETGKRVKEADVVMDAIENGGTYYTAKTLRYSGNFADKNFASPITAYKWLARTSDGSMEIVRCDRVNGKSTYTTIYQIGCDGGDELIESAELDAHLKEIRGTSGAFTEKERREEQITLRMKSDNLSREQAEELVDYIRANREHYNSEVAATVKAMLDNFKKINNPEPSIAETANEELDGYNPDVFSLLPKLEDLNDVDGEFDEDAAEETDRDDRYNRGEKIAEGLTAKLRAFDPTVEVTYTIDDGEDTYYLSYDGIARTPFTATGVETSFHAMKQYDAETDCPPEPPTPKPNSPFDIARGLNDVFQKTFHRVDAPYLDVLTQDGAKIVTNFGATFISVDWSATDGYVFGNHFNDVLARYETPEQVTDVMTALRDAIEAGKTEFTFPTVDEIDPIDFEKFFAEHEANQPAEVKALNAELDASKLQAPHMWVRIVDGAGHHRGSFTRGLLSAVHVEYNAEPAAIEGYTLRYFDEPMRLYNTFAQVNAAVEQFKAAIISNAEAFTFPTVEALTPETPATAVEETDYEKYLKASEYVITSPGRYLGTDKFGEDRFAVTWKTRCPLRKINKATARNILATFGLTPETYLAEHSKWVAAEIKRGSLQFAIDMQAEFLRDKIAADRKASVEPMPTLYPAEDSDADDELIDPPVKPVDAAHISDSLTRAMKTALEQFQGFCLVKNLTAAENELKLYNICREAMTELWKEETA